MPEQPWRKREQNMVYKLNITEHADSLLNALLYHLLFSLKNEQAARHLLDEIDKIYVRLEENPLQFGKLPGICQKPEFMTQHSCSAIYRL